MQDFFDFRNRLIDEYSAFLRSFSRIAAPNLSQKVEDEYERGRYWPEPLIQINPNYKRSGTVQELVKQGSLHAACASLFQTGTVEGKPMDLHVYVHQMQAIAKAQNRQSYQGLWRRTRSCCSINPKSIGHTWVGWSGTRRKRCVTPGSRFAAEGPAVSKSSRHCSAKRVRGAATCDEHVVSMPRPDPTG